MINLSQDCVAKSTQTGVEILLDVSLFACYLLQLINHLILKKIK